jgi:ElaB/YqjD/DUF883 family membrane-anchored ribosome-binding protein
MAAKEHPGITGEANVERSTEDIRQDITKGRENISQAVEQIGERIEEKLDWRGYVRDAPFLAMGVAAGLGYLASGMFISRTTPLERIMDSIADEIHDSLGGLRAGAGTAGPGLIKVALLGIATQVAANWIKNATSPTAASGGAPSSRAGRGSTAGPDEDI